jgi:siderophore synthetase component
MATRIANETKVADISPLLFRLRKSAVRMLPAHVQNAMVRLKANLFSSGHL